jgi:4a-hydroxytetrahydrobiopterin dehydratase
VARLSEAEVAEALRGLPAWERSGDAIVRTIRFPDFMAGIGFVNRVAELAEAADHHPDIDIRYRTIRLELTTHDENGLTERDVALARRIDQATQGGSR